MSAIQWLCQLVNIKPTMLSKKENAILEAEFFLQICTEYQKNISAHLSNYFRVMKFNAEKEEAMFEENFLPCIINDILTTEEYTLEGMSRYTQIPEEILYEIAAGMQTNPSLLVARKILELHRSIRPELYKNILIKATQESILNP